MDSLANILNSRPTPAPDEIKIIKDFVRERYTEDVRVEVGPHSIVIRVSNSSLAGQLRHDIRHLQQLCNTDKKMTVRLVF